MGSRTLGLLVAPILLAFPLWASAQAVKIANEGDIGGDWRIADGARLEAPGYPATFAPQGQDVCVAMGYRIYPDGTTGDFTMLRGWSSRGGEREPEAGFWDTFSRAAAGALAQWRFQPRDPGRAMGAVDTVATMVFVGHPGQDVPALRARCKVADLAADLQEAKVRMARRGDINQHTMDNNYRETTRNESKRNVARSGLPVD